MATHPSLQVAVADDHPVIRLSIEAALADIPTVTHVESVANSTDLMHLLEHQTFDVLITDYAMPGGSHGDGLELISFVKTRFPDLAIVVMTGIDDSPTIRGLLAAGIKNIVSKADGTTHIGPAMQAAIVRRRYFSPAITSHVASQNAGQAKLTSCEAKVLLMFMAGASINQISADLHKAKQTISTQKNRAMKKLGIANDADLFKHSAEVRLLISSP